MRQPLSTDNRQLTTNAFVYYRLPGENRISYLEGQLTPWQPEKAMEGFAVAPYSESPLLLMPEISRQWESPAEAVPPLEDQFQYHNAPAKSATEATHYIQGVEAANRAFADGQLKKVVLARTGTENWPEDLSPFEFYIQLCRTYPLAFCVFFGHPDLGIWLGCSPELLLCTHADGTLETMALAGTINPAMGQQFTSKETEEQALVTAFIRERLRPFLSAPAEETGPAEAQAGHLRHLRTLFRGTLAEAWKQSSLSVAVALHPTPAVGGLPLDAALQFQKEHEDFDRELYAGYWGPVSGTEARLFVNLRCMQWMGGIAMFYAGAGLVEGSIPEKEWTETESKINTLRNVLLQHVRCS